MTRTFAYLLGSLALLGGIRAIGQDSCVSFTSSNNLFPIVNNKKASPILISPDEWPGVQIAAADFQADIQRVTSVKPSLSNFTSPASSPAASKPPSGTPIIIGTLGKSSLIDHIVNTTKLDVSSIEGKWESFLTRVVNNPLPGVSSAYVIIGADKRGTIFALYDHSEQFGTCDLLALFSGPYSFFLSCSPPNHDSITSAFFNLSHLNLYHFPKHISD